MAFSYDAEGNIVQNIATSSVGFNQGVGVVVSPLTNAAINGNASPTGAPNTFGTVSRDLSPKTTVTSAFGTNGSGQVCFNFQNPA
jgi:hypothetical protein